VEYISRYVQSIASWILLAQIVLLAVAMSIVVVPIQINWLVGPSTKTLLALGAKTVGLVVNDKEWWRLISSLFLYGGLFQLVAMVSIHTRVGVFLEHQWGCLQWLGIYLLSGAYGNMASAICNPSLVTVGGAVGLAGVMGAWFIDLMIRGLSIHPNRSRQEFQQKQVQVELLMWTMDMAVLLLCSFVIYNDPMAILGACFFGTLMGIPFFAGKDKDVITWHMHVGRTLAAVVALLVFAATAAYLFTVAKLT